MSCHGSCDLVVIMSDGFGVKCEDKLPGARRTRALHTDHRRRAANRSNLGVT